MVSSISDGNRAPITGTRAREALAELLTQEFGVSISPKDIESLFARRWDRLRYLAHAVHDNYEPTLTAYEAAQHAPHGENR